MTKLEQTIVDNARRELDAVVRYYRKKGENTSEADFDDTWREYLGHFNTMNAFLRTASRLCCALRASKQPLIERNSTEVKAGANVHLF